ncbi:dihydrolipoamide acetyltransferase family protein [Paraliomyxa miuraensis]|uniref:dihydrolipoamide acetyltransferase family protein n=1 Tax=Paraliomyxa miuraensis TaxID=376150 RepID=UPI00224EB624|nr:dihydrolipoamide acetyltransferase family protein [Paraliomyxa miuraensis]MCX4239777.1 2-oxo acid dehydrogenase subunit E2 [Paraliomyxa miuraensis]
MAKIVELPRLSDTMEEGVIAKWHVAEGDKVKRGQLIAEIETDKATMEFESFDAGVVLRLLAPEGETMAIGTPIAVLGKPGEDVEAALAAHGSGGATAAPAEAAPEPAAKAAPEPAPEPAAAPTEAAAAPAPSATPAPPASPAEGDRAPGRIAASPLARRLAREHGIELSSITGSGPHGRVIKTDVEAAAAGRAAAPGAAPAAASVPAGVELDASGRPLLVRPDEPVKLSQMRKAIARRMSQANAEIPHFYLTTVVDMDRAVALRDQLKSAIEAKVSFNDLVLMAASRALRVHPEVNAYWDGQTVVRRGNVHLGVAVAVDEGLIVPVVRHADQKGLRELAEQARDLGLRGRDKKLAPQEMSGSTFTVSNLGMFGIDEFSAVINPGEGAILAVGAIADTVVVVDGQVGVGKRMKMTLACDHRVMDGATGAKFLATMRGLLEQPLAMLA